MTGSSTPIEIFYSYAHADEALRAELEKHLSLLQRQGVIRGWHDRLIALGTDWAQAIDEHLERASVILLLVSADFLASDYCYGIEMQRVLERHQANEAAVIPILLRPVDWHGAPFAHLQSLPTDAKAITTWRNQDEAFADVAAGIRRAVEALSSLQAAAPRAALPPIWNVPFPRNEFFTGREGLLTNLAQQLQVGHAMAITGLGGIGKTQLAIEYAYRHRTNYQAVLWAHAYSYEALISSYVTIAFLLHLPEQKAQEQEVVVQAIKTWLQTHSGWLLILDNADDLAVLHAFLPPDYSGHILLTTRAQAMGRLARRLNMDTLSSDLGTLFLLHRTGLLATEATLEQASPTDRQAAESLTFDLGGLPLALDQAGAYIEETGSSLAAYQQLYRHHRAALLRDRRGQVFDHPDPVATTWALDFQRIEQAQPAAIDLLRLCAFLASDSVPEELLTAGAPYLGPILGPVVADTFLLNQAIEALRTRSLIQWDPTRKTLSIHCLVQAVLQDSIGQEERQQWIERTVQAVWAAFPRAEFIHWPACERCLPHAQACLSLIEQESITSAEAAQLLTRMGWYFMECGRYQEARVSVQQTLQLQERDLEPVHLGTAQSLNLLARLHEKQGEYALAEPLYQRALAIYEKQLGSEHPHVATSLNNLAVLYMSQGKYEQAEPLYVRSLAIYEKHMGPGHPNTATSLNNLASLFRKQGKYEQAEPLYQKTLAIYEQHMGPEHPSIATSLNNLALLYKIQGKYEQAEPLYQHALAIYEKHLGPRHPDTATSFNNLAGLYEQQGMYAEAEPLYQQAFSIREEHLEPGHPDIATSLNNLARLYERQSKYEQAEPLYQHALAIFEQKLGPRHPDTLVVRENYAWLLRAIGHSTVET